MQTLNEISIPSAGAGVSSENPKGHGGKRLLCGQQCPAYTATAYDRSLNAACLLWHGTRRLKELNSKSLLKRLHSKQDLCKQQLRINQQHRPFLAHAVYMVLPISNSYINEWYPTTP